MHLLALCLQSKVVTNFAETLLKKEMSYARKWATGYDVIAIPLAAGVLYKMGILLSPAIGAVFMSISTVIVTFNAKPLNLK